MNKIPWENFFCLLRWKAWLKMQCIVDLINASCFVWRNVKARIFIEASDNYAVRVIHVGNNLHPERPQNLKMVGKIRRKTQTKKKKTSRLREKLVVNLSRVLRLLQALRKIQEVEVLKFGLSSEFKTYWTHKSFWNSVVKRGKLGSLPLSGNPSKRKKTMNSKLRRWQRKTTPLYFQRC